MKQQRKRISSSNYYIEPLNEDDFGYEDDSSYDNSKKHPNLGQRLNSISLQRSDLQQQDYSFESSDSTDLSLSQSAKLLFASEFDSILIELLHKFLNPTGKILARTETSLSSRQQRKISKIIRRARANGLIECVL